MLRFVVGQTLSLEDVRMLNLKTVPEARMQALIIHADDRKRLYINTLRKSFTNWYEELPRELYAMFMYLTGGELPSRLTQHAEYEWAFADELQRQFPFWDEMQMYRQLERRRILSYEAKNHLHFTIRSAVNEPIVQTVYKWMDEWIAKLSKRMNDDVGEIDRFTAAIMLAANEPGLASLYKVRGIINELDELISA